MPVASLAASGRAALCGAALLAMLCPSSGCGDSGFAGGGGFGGEAPTPCAFGFIGDPALEPEIEVFAFGADGQDHPVSADGILDLIEPPQGGRVIFVGARARNIDGCGPLLTGALRDPTTDQLRFDTRSVNLAPDEDGWGSVARGDLSVYSNIPACANSWADQDIFGGTFDLEVKIVDRDGRKAETVISVSTQCTDVSQAETPPDVTLAGCLCTCKQGYITGESCDGGGGSGGAGGAGGGS